MDVINRCIHVAWQKIAVLVLFFFTGRMLANAQTAAPEIDSSISVKEQLFLEDYPSINTLKQLTARLKGKPAFIDLWTSWCGPCRQEFYFKDSLVAFLKTEDIQMVYLSLDEDKFETRWKELIRYFKLSGTHLRANDRLRYDLSKVIWKQNGGFSIPRYILLDAQGNLINSKTLHPRAGERLYQQIRLELKR